MYFLTVFYYANIWAVLITLRRKLCQLTTPFPPSFTLFRPKLSFLAVVVVCLGGAKKDIYVGVSTIRAG